MGVAALFQTFCDDLLISSDTRSVIATRYNAICTRLNKDFWNVEGTSGGRYIGSFGRNTANGRVSDIDMIFEMPLTLPLAVFRPKEPMYRPPEVPSTFQKSLFNRVQIALYRVAMTDRVSELIKRSSQKV